MTSISVKIAPQDHRCRYWAKLVRAGTPLPLPSAVTSAGDIPAAYARRGDEELMPGDFLFEGEENHHRNARGWSYWVHWIGADGVQHTRRSGFSDQKAGLKSAGIGAEYLPGAGEPAAMIRIAHGVRQGLEIVE